MVQMRSLFLVGISICLQPIIALLIPAQSIASGSLLQAPPWNQTNRAGPLFPDEDSFYTPTPGFESAKLGAILKHRPVPRPITIDNKNGLKLKDAWQILYRTQNSVGEPEANVVTVLVPFKPNAKKLFSFQFFSV
jgi:hypothetical protein